MFLSFGKFFDKIKFNCISKVDYLYLIYLMLKNLKTKIKLFCFRCLMTLWMLPKMKKSLCIFGTHLWESKGRICWSLLVLSSFLSYVSFLVSFYLLLALGCQSVLEKGQHIFLEIFILKSYTVICRVLADGHIPWACEAFSKLHGEGLVSSQALFWYHSCST